MVKKTVKWVCVLVFVAALSPLAFADQSTGYTYYYNEGVKAFQDHDDQKALRCFKIAQIYDPNDRDLKNYLAILDQRGVVLLLPASTVLPQDSIGYKYYLKAGIEALAQNDKQGAVHYFTIALIFYPGSIEADLYLRGLATPVVVPNYPAIAAVQPPIIQPSSSVSNIVPEVSEPLQYPTSKTTTEEILVPSPQTTQPPSQPQIQEQQAQPETETQGQSQVQQQPQSETQPQAQGASPLQSQTTTTTVNPQPTVYTVTQQKPKQPPQVLALSQIISSGNAKPTLSIDLNSTLILEGRNIQRFLVVDEGFIGVKIIDTDHLEIDALRIGTTFLHVWDNSGRHTFYVEVVFPKPVISGNVQPYNGIQHGRPFLVTYSNDWSSYYTGKDLPAMKRQSYEFDQSLAVTGDTPYGFFDTSGSYTDDGQISEFDTYTIGLSHIPVEGTSNFNLRGFDALRYLSPLTMPTTRLRGAFADVDLLDDYLGLSVSHGQEQQPLGFIDIGGNQFLNTDIDAVKLTLLPKNNNDQLSFNYATSYGSDRPSYLTDHVYSVEGQHKFNDFLTLNAEEGSDSSHAATLASLGWADMGFKSALNFRNIDKDYSDISTLPANQGETGATWTTDAEYQNLVASSFIEAYQDHLYPNPEDPRALNYDGNGHVKVNLTPTVWTDSDMNYVDTSGESSPSRSLGLSQKISKSFGIWNSMKGVVFGGVGYENSHSSGSDISDFDYEDVIAGIQLPLTRLVSANASYQYDWLSQPINGDSTPSVIDMGLQYQRQLSPKLSFTSQISFHDELGVLSTNTGVLSGEESVNLSSGFNYNPSPDVNFFGDVNASKVLSHVGDPSYDDFEVHLGVRLTFGGATYWDPLGTVSGIVFKDRNRDGKFGPGDAGIPGVKVQVGDKTATTDKDGRYHVQIHAKSVDVAPVLDTVPGGLLFSTPQSLNVPVLQGRVTRADFGLIIQTGIYGIIFVDKNGSGAPNEEDKFVGKVKVILDGKITQKSDSHGAFYFRDVKPGTHTIAIDINSLAIDMVPTLKLTNTIDVTEGTNYMFNVPVQIKQAEGDQN